MEGVLRDTEEGHGAGALGVDDRRGFRIATRAAGDAAPARRRLTLRPVGGVRAVATARAYANSGKSRGIQVPIPKRAGGYRSREGTTDYPARGAIEGIL